MPQYLCAGCGATYEEKNPPCRQCASERFAILDDTDRLPDQIQGTIDLAWRCTGCRQTHIRNNPPCDSCGTLEYEAVYDGVTESVEADTSTSAIDTDSHRITVGVIVAYLYGVVALYLFLGWFSRSVPGAISLGLSGLVAMPVIRRWVDRQFGVQFSTGAVWFLVGALFTIGIWLIV